MNVPRAGCWHCGDTLPPDPPQALVAGAPHPVCCQGCRAAVEWIDQLGLADYYRLRSATPPRLADPARSRRSADVWQRPDLVRHVVRILADGRR